MLKYKNGKYNVRTPENQTCKESKKIVFDYDNKDRIMRFSNEPEQFEYSKEYLKR